VTYQLLSIIVKVLYITAYSNSRKNKSISSVKLYSVWGLYHWRLSGAFPISTCRPPGESVACYEGVLC